MEITHFNPRLQDEGSFLANFVARQRNLAFFIQQLEQASTGQPANHHIMVAPRGYGKTSLLRRIAIAIRQSDTLKQRYIPLGFREEQHNVISLDVFWNNCLLSLQEAREAEGAPPAELDQLEALADAHAVRNTLPRDDQDGEPAWQALLAATQAIGRRPVLLIDNLDSLLLGLSGKHQWGLRRVLQSAQGPLLIAAAPSYPETMADPAAAFYGFFQSHTLAKLEDQEVMQCLAEIAKHRGALGQKVLQQLQQNAGRVAALNLLAGGNPRTLGVLYRVLEGHMSDDILSQLGQMLDTFTGWYQARTEELPAQARAVFDALALAWDPVTAAVLAQATGLDTPTVSSQLARLEKSGHAEAVPLNSHSKGRNGYQVAERFYNVWYLMRNGSLRTAKRIRFLTAFLQSLFSTSERLQIARDLLAQGNGATHTALALAQTLRPSSLRYSLLQSVAQNISQTESADLASLARLQLEAEPKPRRNGAKTGANQAAFEAHQQATAARLAGDYVAAEAACRQAIALDAKDARLWSNLGLLLQDHLGRYEEAEAAYRQAIALDAKLAAPCYNLGNLLQNHLGRYEEAETAYRQAIGLDAKKAFPWNGLGNLLQNHLGRYKEAEAAYRQAIALDAKLAFPWFALGSLLQNHLGRYKEAETAYRQAIALDAKNARPWNNLGSLLKNHLNRHEEAEAAYRRAIALDAKNASSWSGLGLLLQNQPSRYEEAEVAYRQAIALDAKGVGPWFGLGLLLQNHLGRYEEAEAAYRQAIALDAKGAGPWFGLGLLLQDHLGRYEEAEAAYRQAKNLGWLGLEMQLGNLLLDFLGRPHEAVEVYQPALLQMAESTKVSAKQAMVSVNLAYAYALRLGDANAALAHAQQALVVKNRLSPSGRTLLEALPCFWPGPDRWDASWELIRQAFELDDPELFTNYLDDLQRLLSWMIAHGQGAYVLQEMEAAKFPDKYAPAYHAVKAAVEGEDHLLRINPETRAPALRLYGGLARMLKLYPPKSPVTVLKKSTV